MFEFISLSNEYAGILCVRQDTKGGSDHLPARSNLDI